jgi:hypothetical protein
MLSRRCCNHIGAITTMKSRRREGERSDQVHNMTLLQGRGQTQAGPRGFSNYASTTLVGHGYLIGLIFGQYFDPSGRGDRRGKLSGPSKQKKRPSVCRRRLVPSLPPSLLRTPSTTNSLSPPSTRTRIFAAPPPPTAAASAKGSSHHSQRQQLRGILKRGSFRYDRTYQRRCVY